MKVFWKVRAIEITKLQNDVVWDGLSGSPKNFSEDAQRWIKEYSLDVVYPEDDENLWYRTDKEDKKLVGFRIGSDLHSARMRLGKLTSKKIDFDGLYLYHPQGSYISWAYQKDWIGQIISYFKDTYGEKEVHVEIQTPASISDIYGLADAIHIAPLDGILYGSRFLLPMNGYIDLNNEEATDSMREAVEKASDLLNFHFKDSKGSYDDFLSQLQVHVFNYELTKHLYTLEHKDLKGFSYRGKSHNSESVYALAAMRGIAGERSLIELSTEAENALKLAAQSGDTTNVLESISRLYAILLARVELGTKMDSDNQSLSKVVSGDINNALKNGVKLVEIIEALRKNRFAEKVDYARLQIEQEKLRILQSQGLKPEEEDQEAKVYEMAERIETAVVDEFVEN